MGCCEGWRARVWVDVLEHLGVLLRRQAAKREGLRLLRLMRVLRTSIHLRNNTSLRAGE